MKALSAEKHWFVIRTNIACEEKAERNLRGAGFEVYFPRQRIERRNKRTHTKRIIERPLLQRYLFIGMPIGHQHFGFARACEGVEDFLRNNSKPLRIPFPAVEAFYLAEIDMKFDETEQARLHMEEKFAPGTLHRIMEGPFEGFIAKVKELQGRRVEAALELFNGLATIHLTTDKLEAA